MNAQKSIAVLPFVNRSVHTENEFFCDGMTEEIINSLAKIKQLKVTSKTSSFYFKGKNTPLSEIARTLNVSAILEGSVRLHDNQIRVSAQLINVKDDTHIWSETWDRFLDNVFEIQDEISLFIADKLREQFGHFDIQEHLNTAPTYNLDAYQECLLGRSLFNKWNPEDVNAAITHFEKAVMLDPNLIEAHTGLADGYSFLAVAGFAPREKAWKKSIDHLEKAKSIDHNNAPLNYLLANQAFFTEASFEKAMEYIQIALVNKPNYSEAIQFIAFLFILRGDKKEAQKYILFAKSIDPLNQETKFYEAYFHYRFRQYNRAKSLLEELLEANNRNLPAVITMAYLLLKTAEFDQADKILNNVPGEMIMPDEKLGLQCIHMALSGENEALGPMLNELEKNALNDSSFQAHAYLYKVYCCLDKYDEAFKILEKLFNNKSSILLLSFGDPLAESIQVDTRYKKYHSRIYRLHKLSSQSKSKSSSLDNSTANTYLTRLYSFMEQETPYLNPTLTLRELAGQIEIHPNQLSWLLNEKIGKNFNTFINKLRIEHFKELILKPENNHISLLGLAYESGFNSKTAFNTAFKRETGITPKEYMNNTRL
ncbi:helix-turn-helix domain-containing protein [Membranihabitans maritimus]|uniref:helix-turn-helix domain-containing protein n=1 Tax=Membranihabitans maritimus TaxID=2904244 RepID=UPI001F016ED9